MWYRAKQTRTAHPHTGNSTHSLTILVDSTDLVFFVDFPVAEHLTVLPNGGAGDLSMDTIPELRDRSMAMAALLRLVTTMAHQLVHNPICYTQIPLVQPFSWRFQLGNTTNGPNQLMHKGGLADWSDSPETWIS